MAQLENPALKEFVAQIGDELTLAQLLIRRSGRGYELRHVEDYDVAEKALRPVPPDAMRQLAQYTSAGEFRPLKSAPTLQRGWRMDLGSDVEMGVALNHLYPGAVADWLAARAPKPPVTNYREFTRRQSGMYRITTLLADKPAAAVIQSCCNKNLCLKRRMWTNDALEPDSAETKSIIPCLEPCAVLLEAARKAVRAAQEQEKSAGSELAHGMDLH